MHFTMFREPSVNGTTLSKLFLGLDFVCDILEDEVREIKGTPVAEWKLHGATAIPEGTYEVDVSYSQRFGPQTLTLMNVPGFLYIRIHGGNTNADTEGCLLPGVRLGEDKVTQSRVTLQKLKDLILPVIGRGEKVTIEIHNPSVEA
jgi:hypothetical protein